MGRVKVGGGGGGEIQEKMLHFLSPLSLPLSFFHPSTYPKGCYFYSPESSSVIKSKMAATQQYDTNINK